MTFKFGGAEYYKPSEKPEEAYAILDEFVEVCEQLGIGYWLYMGTVLGFYRDKGWNKWDRDIDVIMLTGDWPAVKEAMLARGYRMLPHTMHLINEHRILLNVTIIPRTEKHFGAYDVLECNDREYRAPYRIAAYLRETYGPDWETPIAPENE